jgi:hypothetical protein
VSIITPETISEAVRAAILYQLCNINTALPGIIVSYDYTQQRASIQPAINKLYTDGTTQALPILNNVPVIFPASGGASISFPVSVGDTCLVVFAQRSIDNWKLQGGQVTPFDPRKLDLSDGMAIVGLNPFNKVAPAQNNTDLQISYQGSTITIKHGGNISIDGGNISVSGGNISINGSGVAIGNSGAELVSTLTSFMNQIVSMSVLNPTFVPLASICELILPKLALIQGTL